LRVGHAGLSGQVDARIDRAGRIVRSVHRRIVGMRILGASVVCFGKRRDRSACDESEGQGEGRDERDAFHHAPPYSTHMPALSP
jgi:hypothetical protein